MEQGKQKPEAEAEQRQPDGEGSTELPTTFGFSRNFESERDEAEDETVGSKQDEQAEDDVFVLRAKIEAEEAERKRLGSEHVNEEQKKNMLKLLHLRSEENKIKRTQSAATEHVSEEQKKKMMKLLHLRSEENKLQRTQSAATEHVSEEEKKNMMKLLHLRSEENKLKRTKSAATNSGSRMPEMAQNERQGDNTNASAGAPRGGGVAVLKWKTEKKLTVNKAVAKRQQVVETTPKRQQLQEKTPSAVVLQYKSKMRPGNMERVLPLVGEPPQEK
eukprot:g12133.t1